MHFREYPLLNTPHLVIVLLKEADLRVCRLSGGNDTRILTGASACLLPDSAILAFSINFCPRLAENAAHRWRSAAM